MLGPAVRALRTAFPASQITLLASPAGAQAAPLLPWIDDVFVHRPVWQDVGSRLPFSPQREEALVAALRERGFDAAFLFTSFSQSPYPPAYVCYLAGIPVRVGQARDFGGSLLTHWVKPPPDETQQAERNLYLLEALGFAISERALELVIPPAASAVAERLLLEAGVEENRGFVALAPGASCDARRYDPGRFGAVAAALVTETGLPVVLLGTKRERELARTVLAASSSPSVVSLVGGTTVPELAAIVSRAALVIANNSGSLHLADACRRPLLVTFSGSEYEEQWRPRSSPAALLRRPTWCSPCYRFECPYEKQCLDLPPEEVVAAALSLLPVAEAP